MEDCANASGCELLEQERRRPLTPEEIENVKDQLLDSIYADIGKSVTKKFLWVFGAVMLALLAWMTGAGHVKLG